MEGSVQTAQALLNELEAMRTRIVELEQIAAMHQQMFIHEKDVRNALEIELQQLQEIHERQVYEASTRQQTVQEITRGAEEQAREFETVIEAITDALAVYDANGRIVRMNQAFRELLGIPTHPDYSSRPLSERGSSIAIRDEHEVLLPVEHWPVHRILRGEILTSKSITDITISALDGREIQINVSGAPMYDEQGNIVGAVALYRDVTAPRKNELALLEANRRMDEFLSIASHELRTPLTTIKGNIQLAKRRLKLLAQEELPGNFTEKLDLVQELLGRSERQVHVQNRLVGDLLDVSRIQANRLELHMEPLNLAAIVIESVEDQRAVMPSRTISLEMAVEEAVPILADRDRIFQVVTNYLTNALKYSSSETPVVVRLSTEDGVARLSVRDHGPGLPLGEQKRLWQRFYRVPGVKVLSGSGVGLGLGLYICRTIIERHNGQVGVQSVPGDGATFWFTLALA